MNEIKLQTLENGLHKVIDRAGYDAIFVRESDHIRLEVYHKILVKKFFNELGLPNHYAESMKIDPSEATQHWLLFKPENLNGLQTKFTDACQNLFKFGAIDTRNCTSTCQKNVVK